MKKHFTLLVFLITIFKATSQTGFSNIYNGCAAPAIIVNSFENGFITCGSGGIMKIDSVGNIIWSKTTNQYYDYITRTMDSCYIATGSSSNNLVRCIKFDLNGDTIWSRAISVSEVSQVSSITETSDSSILITGIQDDTSGVALDKMFILKLDHAGTLVWMKTYQTANFENVLFGIKEGPDHNYYAFGYIEYHTTNFYFKAVLISLSPAGNILWNRTFTDSITPVMMLLDLEFLDSGMLCYLNIGGNAMLTKTDTSGIQLWSKKYNFYSGPYYATNSKNIFRIRDNDYYLSSRASSAIVEVDSLGQILNAYETLNGVPCEDFVLTPDSQFAYIGYGFSGAGIVRYDSNTVTSCVFASSGQSFIDDTLLTDSVVYTIGTDGAPVNDTVQFSPCTTYVYINMCPDWEAVEQISPAESITIFPNPTTSKLYIQFKDQSIPYKLDVMDFTGQLIKMYNYSDYSSGSINLAGISDGIYLIKFYFEQIVVVKTICIQTN